MAAEGEPIPVGSVWERNSDHHHVVVTGLTDLGYGLSDVYWVGDGNDIESGRCTSHLWPIRFRRVTAQTP